MWMSDVVVTCVVIVSYPGLVIESTKLARRRDLHPLDRVVGRAAEQFLGHDSSDFFDDVGDRLRVVVAHIAYHHDR